MLAYGYRLRARDDVQQLLQQDGGFVHLELRVKRGACRVHAVEKKMLAFLQIATT